jgi:hypothetical protein
VSITATTLYHLKKLNNFSKKVGRQTKTHEKKKLIASATKTFRSHGAARKPHPELNLGTPAVKVYLSTTELSGAF